MRHIDRLPKPAILREKQAEWQEKYDAKLATDPHARPDSSKYAHKEIKDALYAMSYGKCFYCETKLSGGNMEVDHFKGTGDIRGRGTGTCPKPENQGFMYLFPRSGLMVA